MTDSSRNGTSLGPNHAVTAWHDVLLSYFPTDVTLEALRAVHEANVRLGSAYPSGTVTLAVVGSGIAIPRREVRAYAAQIGRDVSASLRGECIVVSGHPFWVGMARSTLRTIELLSASWHPRQVFADVAPAAQWVLERSAEYRADVRLLERAFGELFGAWEAAYGRPMVRAK